MRCLLFFACLFTLHYCTDHDNPFEFLNVSDDEHRDIQEHAHGINAKLHEKKISKGTITGASSPHDVSPNVFGGAVGIAMSSLAEAVFSRNTDGRVAKHGSGTQVCEMKVRTSQSQPTPQVSEAVSGTGTNNSRSGVSQPAEASGALEIGKGNQVTIQGQGGRRGRQFTSFVSRSS